MRISDWSSDVCSSDLILPIVDADGIAAGGAKTGHRGADPAPAAGHQQGSPHFDTSLPLPRAHGARQVLLTARRPRLGSASPVGRSSEEHPVGKEWVSTGRYRW